MAMYVILGLIILAGLWLWSVYNGLVTLNVRTEEAWSDIEVQLKRRYDLIPNLVNTVKGYATHESSAFENVTKARAAAMGAQTPTEHAAAENMLSSTLKSLFAISEAYPELKANQNFLDLQHELRDAEDKIQAARRFYNANARDLNIKMQVFPSNLVAQSLGFKKRDFFDLPDNDAAQQNPEVKF
ncbi:MAG TPA: LemA family protein [Candidatus Baltobacteraceae bacterium]|nr:LemA family protein [Candidatus Baltobacteraceae bacterium]